MRTFSIALLAAFAASSLIAQQMDGAPSDAKAQKLFLHGLEAEKKHDIQQALSDFKKADKQNGGHCATCQKKMIEYGIDLEDWDPAETAAREMLAEAQGPNPTAYAHFQVGLVLMRKAMAKNKDELYAQAHEEFAKALSGTENFPSALYTDGWALAKLKQDDQAKAQFEKFSALKGVSEADRQRAIRYSKQPELVRARMAPGFVVTTLDGQKVSLDDLQGKVVLLDFWATWCGPCREALPRMRSIAKSFQGQPLVVLSISLDDDEKKWKDFVAKNEMTWLQYNDGGFNGPVAKLFAVHAIPQTFTIDPSGVLQDQHIGDAAIEGKLKKLVSQVQQKQAGQNSQPEAK